MVIQDLSHGDGYTTSRCMVAWSNAINGTCFVVEATLTPARCRQRFDFLIESCCFSSCLWMGNQKVGGFIVEVEPIGYMIGKVFASRHCRGMGIGQHFVVRRNNDKSLWLYRKHEQVGLLRCLAFDFFRQHQCDRALLCVLFHKTLGGDKGFARTNSMLCVELGDHQQQ